MSSFFIVKGELAAWALGLDQDDVVPAEETVLMEQASVGPPVPRRRKRRLGHEDYRTLLLRRRELIER